MRSRMVPWSMTRVLRSFMIWARSAMEVRIFCTSRSLSSARASMLPACIACISVKPGSYSSAPPSAKGLLSGSQPPPPPPLFCCKRLRYAFCCLRNCAPRLRTSDASVRSTFCRTFSSVGVWEGCCWNLWRRTSACLMRRVISCVTTSISSSLLPVSSKVVNAAWPCNLRSSPILALISRACRRAASFSCTYCGGTTPAGPARPCSAASGSTWLPSAASSSLLASPLTSEEALMPRALFLYFTKVSVRFLVVPRAPPWLMFDGKPAPSTHWVPSATPQ
mmetsp:Transcript_18453/g.55687  ORF Transcript_18453/g.55687 Transcript_18453/m.55687 type:complete len:278 (-) Transcript_18453:240-1073(-)